MKTVLEPAALHLESSPSHRVLPRLAGILLLAATLPPWYLLLRHPRSGYAGNTVVAHYAVYAEFMWSGLLVVILVALIAGVLGARGTLRGVLGRVARPPRRHVRFAVALALISFLLTLAFSLVVLEGKPNLIDSLAQALHARFWAEGRLAGPLTDGGGFWAIQNSLFTPRGWVSQYPPGHVALLAAGFALGAPHVVGPLLAAATVFPAALLAQRLFPDDLLSARLGPALLAVSPFFIGLSGTYMNHVTAAAFTTLGAYALVRAWQDRSRWAFLAGAAFAFSLATRPLATLAIGTAVTLTAPSLVGSRVWSRRFMAINGLAVVGALPFLAMLLLYNAYFFGGPLTTGYDIALGPATQLGFHQDPWGNMYGLREALAYTSADLLTLGVNLFESPLSAVVVIAAFLLLSRSIGPAVSLLSAWALAPVLSNALYWHHGLFMGPRMLHEAAPAWVLLFGVAAVRLVREMPDITPRFSLRAATSTAIFGSLVVGLGVLAPQRLSSYGGAWLDIMRLPAPQLEEPGLVFVHDAWAGRVAMSLAASGHRLDIVETLMRQNSTCEVHSYVRTLNTGNAAAASAAFARLDTAPRSDRLPLRIDIAPGDRIRAWPNETFPPECHRQIRSDRFGILDLSPLLWQGDLPDGDRRGALYARDLGPSRNRDLIRLHPRRTPWLYALTEPDGEPRLLPYEEGMMLLWGDHE